MSKKECIDSNQQNHLGNALTFMCRYSYSRKTSADMACNSALKSLWEFLPDNKRRMIVEEVEDNKDLVDPTLWDDFLKWESKNRIENTIVEKGFTDEYDRFI